MDCLVRLDVFRFARKCPLICSHSSILLSLLELYDSRARLRVAKRISNPGCYATSMQLLLAPLVPYMDIRAPPTVFGVSGYSGAGTLFTEDLDGRPVTVPKVHPADLHGGNGLRPYALTDHIHEREVSVHLSRLVDHSPTDPRFSKPTSELDVETGPLAETMLEHADKPLRVAFVPVVASWYSGIISTASVPLTKVAVERRMHVREFKALYEERYGREKLIKLLGKGPEVGDVEGQHGWVLGGIQLHSSGERIVAVGGLDNLLKGAATQCLQVSGELN